MSNDFLFFRFLFFIIFHFYYLLFIPFNYMKLLSNAILLTQEVRSLVIIKTYKMCTAPPTTTTHVHPCIGALFHIIYLFQYPSTPSQSFRKNLWHI